MKACYERAVFVDGSDALSWYRLGRYYDRQHSSSDAARCYERAVQLFLNPESVRSGSVRRIYISRHTLFDDVIPNGWLLYTSPSFDLPSACRRLSEIHQAAGHLEEAKRFAELGQKYAREMDFSNSP
jgi:tetratricopeptide (TPR) repeat protein